MFLLSQVFKNSFSTFANSARSLSKVRGHW